jgi:gamma-glutamylcysteine synthetase
MDLNLFTALLNAFCAGLYADSLFDENEESGWFSRKFIFWTQIFFVVVNVFFAWSKA